MLRLIVDAEPMTGSFNMAIDEALMGSYSELGIPTLRFYKWKNQCLSIGKFQKISEIDVNFLNSSGIELVRRPTGGKAVLHNKEITYSLVISLEFFEKKEVINTYQKISLALRRGFELLGLKTDLSKNKSHIENSFKSACFSAPSIYEITIDGKKLVGSAQVRNSSVILQHGSIPFQLDIDVYSKCFQLSSDKQFKLKRVLESKTIALNQLNPEIKEDDLIKSIAKGFEEVFGFSIFYGNYYDIEMEKANILKNKYESKEWTFKR